jgi:glutathione S-transferase
VITLHTFPGRDGLESLSPFCMKVEVYLKLMKLPYRTTTGGNPGRAPKGKMPFIEQEGGPTLADSSAIIAYFEKKLGEPLDGGMSELEKARAHVLQRTLEEAFYFVVLYTRWVDESGWAVVKSFFDPIPAPFRWAVAPLIRKRVAGSIHAQGTGRHSAEEIYAMGKRDILALSTLLGEGPFFLGERMRTVDVTAYAFLANILRFEVDTSLKAVAQSRPNLVAFVDRVAARVAAESGKDAT